MFSYVARFCVVAGLLCSTNSALAISFRSESVEWQTDLSNSIVIGSVTESRALDPEDEYRDVQEVTCRPVEWIKGTGPANILFRHRFPNAKRPGEGNVSAIRKGQRILIFLVKDPNKDKYVPLNWINLSDPTRSGTSPHIAYDNDCGPLASEESILAVVRGRVKKTANVKNTQRRGLLVMFRPMEDVHHEFVITADPKYRQQFVDLLEIGGNENRCWAIFNLVSYPSKDTIEIIRPMLHDKGTQETTIYEGGDPFRGEPKTVVYYPVRQAAYLALALLGEKVDRPVPYYEEVIPNPFDTGFEDRTSFPYGNWKRLEDILAPPPNWPFDFLKGRKPVSESHDWRWLGYTYAFQADFTATRKAVEEELLSIGFKVADDDPRGFGRKWRSVEYQRGSDMVILFQHMRYVKPSTEDSAHSVVHVNTQGWVSFQVRLGRTARWRPQERASEQR
jgi:hypothetical protein